MAPFAERREHRPCHHVARAQRAAVGRADVTVAGSVSTATIWCRVRAGVPHRDRIGVAGPAVHRGRTRSWWSPRRPPGLRSSPALPRPTHRCWLVPGQRWSDVLAAMLSSVPDAGAVTVTVRVVVAALASVGDHRPRHHVARAHATSRTLTNVAVAGSVSTSTRYPSPCPHRRSAPSRCM